MGKWKRRALSVLLALTLTLSLTGAGLTASAAGGAKEINLFGIGDFGGALDGSEAPTGNPGGARLVGAMKALTGESKNPLVVSGGTLYTGSAMSETNHGKPVNEMLKAMGTVYATVGNHDFDWSTAENREDCFADWEAQGGFQFLSANVYYTEGDKAGERVFTPYGVKTVDGVKIGFFGVINEASMASISVVNTQGIELRSAVDAGVEMVKTLRGEEKCDVVIALAHIGGGQDAPYTEAQPISGPMADFITGVNSACADIGGLDGVMGSQTTAPMCGVVDGTPVVKAQNYGRLIDQLKIVVAADGKVTVTPSLHPLTQIVVDEKSLLGSDENTRANTPEDKDFLKVYNTYNDALTVLMDAQRGTSDAAFSYDGAANQFAYHKWYLRQNYYYVNHVYGEPIVAYFQNTGGIRNIGSTVVNVGDPIALRLLYTVAPFDNYIVTMDMTGKDIKTLLAGKSQYGEYASLKQYGLDVTYASGEYEANGEVLSVKLNGQELADDQVYHIACNSFLSPGPGDSMDFSAGTNAKNINVINRNAVLNALLHRSATLDGLVPSAGKLDAAFVSTDMAPTMHVSPDVTAVTFTATPYDKDAVVKIEGGDALALGENTVTITVTSPYEDPYATPGTVSNVYTVTVVRGYSDEAAIPAWAAPSVAAMSAKGYFKGNQNVAFDGLQPITRGITATLLARMGGATGGEDATGVFTDSVPAWAASSAAWCAEKGIVQSGGAFGNAAVVTREELCVMLARYVDAMGTKLPEGNASDLSGFSDLGSVDKDAKDAVERMIKAGVIDGKSGGVVDPKGEVTRYEAAVILDRFITATAEGK